jgi:predicted transcriptional regulator
MSNSILGSLMQNLVVSQANIQRTFEKQAAVKQENIALYRKVMTGRDLHVSEIADALGNPIGPTQTMLQRYEKVGLVTKVVGSLRKKEPKKRVFWRWAK